MDKISGYVIANAQGGYNVVTKTSQTVSTKPFVIPTEEVATQTATQPYKVSKSFTHDFNSKDALTYIGYDDFDIFKEIKETGSFNIPKYMSTKTEPTRSDEEILKDIETLAKEHARMGIRDHADKRYAKLMDEYVSSVSPDREGLLREQTSEILERLEKEVYIGEDEVPKENKELIDFLMEAIDPKKAGNKEKNDNDLISSFIATRGNSIATSSNGSAYDNSKIISTQTDGYYTQVYYDRGEGRVTALVYDNAGNLQPGIWLKSDVYEATVREKGVVDHAFFYNENGESIASYHDKKLLQKYTSAENKRMQEVLNAYNEAYDLAKAA